MRTRLKTIFANRERVNQLTTIQIWLSLATIYATSVLRLDWRIAIAVAFCMLLTLFVFPSKQILEANVQRMGTRHWIVTIGLTSLIYTLPVYALLWLTFSPALHREFNGFPLEPQLLLLALTGSFLAVSVRLVILDRLWQLNKLALAPKPSWMERAGIPNLGKDFWEVRVISIGSDRAYVQKLVSEIGRVNPTRAAALIETVPSTVCRGVPMLDAYGFRHQVELAGGIVEIENKALSLPAANPADNLLLI